MTPRETGQLMTISKTPVSPAKVLLLALTSSWIIANGVATSYTLSQTAVLNTHSQRSHSSTSWSTCRDHRHRLRYRPDGRHMLHGFVSVGTRPRLSLIRKRQDDASSSSSCCCCCFHFRRRSQSSSQRDDHAEIMYPLVAHSQYPSSICEDNANTCQTQLRISDTDMNTGDDCDNDDDAKRRSSSSQDLIVSSSSYPSADTASSSSSSLHLQPTASVDRLTFDTQQESSMHRGKRTHYNDALLKRILNGRSSHSERWRRRTRRAAVALGIPYSTTNTSSKTLPSTFPLWSWIHTRESRVNENYEEDTEENTNTIEKYTLPLSSLSSIIKPVPPTTSALLQTQHLHKVKIHSTDSSAKRNFTTTSFTQSQSLDNRTSPTKRVFQRQDDDTLSSKKSKIKSSSSSSSSTIPHSRVRHIPLTKEEYDRAKEEWATRYTNISNLRSTFGTNRNKFWGDFDPETTRKLYKTLLPRALLGLYEMGLCSPKDLAPLAYEARLAAKKYARERCVVPGRIFSMVYDGFRSWRTYGKWNVEGMSWEQVWYKYESKIIAELSKNNPEDMDKLNVMRDEITALVCLRILERSCITNDAIDRLFLNKGSMGTNSTMLGTDNNTRYNIQRRKRKAERDIARIAAQLERDMEELLQTPVVSKSMMRNWKESISGNVTSYARLMNMTLVKDLGSKGESHMTTNRIKQKKGVDDNEENVSLSHFLEFWMDKTRATLIPWNSTGTSMFSKSPQPTRLSPTFISPSFDMKTDDAHMILSSISLSSDQTSYDFWYRLISKGQYNNTR